MLASGVTGSADLTDKTVAPARRAKFSSVKNDLKVQVIPPIFAKSLLKVALGLDDITPACQSPALSQPVNVRIDGEARHAEGLRHDDTCRFMAHTWKSLESLKVLGHLTAVLFDQHFAQTANRL